MAETDPFPPIRGLIENTLIDWEGMIAAIVFLPMCNLRCHYCHAAHLLRASPDPETIPLDAVFGLIDQRKGWLDGVVVTGGEPLLHDTLPNLLRAIKGRGVGAKLDTNGTNPRKLAKLIDDGLVDFVAMDVKAPLDWNKYREVAGVDVDISAIRECIDLLMEGRVGYEFRTTVCPKFTNGEDIEAIAKDIAGAKRLVLQPFRPQNLLDKSLLDVKPYHVETLQEFADLAKPYVDECYVRGNKRA